MKKGFYILLLVILLQSNAIWSQANLLNARVPKEVGMEMAENSTPIAYGYTDDRDIFGPKRFGKLLILMNVLIFHIITRP